MSQKIRFQTKPQNKLDGNDWSLNWKESKSTKQSRTRIRSLGDILEALKDAGREGLIVSSISRKANLSHYAAIERCSKLELAGLVETKFVDKKNVHVITEKGLKFFDEYRNFQLLVDPLNLRY